MSTKDQLHRYLFENYQVRGELVQLEASYRDMLASQTYPAPLQSLLGELMVATSLLTATLKFEGSITVQVQGDGPVNLAVINGTHEQQLRGVGRWEGPLAEDANLLDLIGKGHMVITIDPTQGERYQGVVALEKPTLAGCLEDYFAQSEQLHTRLWFKVGQENGTPQAAGMMLQMLPAAGDSHQDDFSHLEQLTNTVKAEELFTLPAEEVLHRLYHQEEVRLFEPQPVVFQCTCSRERSASALISVGKEELTALLKERNTIDLHCDYCGSHYAFDAVDIESIFAGGEPADEHVH